MHRKNSTEIIVHDRASAEALTRVLKEAGQGDQWLLFNDGAQKSPANAQTAPAPAQKKSRNQRKHSRMKILFNMTLITDLGQFRGQSSDISLGGVKIATKLPVELKDQVCRISIEKPDRTESIIFRCRIVAVDKDHARISFIDRDENALRMLKEWLLGATHNFAVPSWMKTA